MIRTQIYLPEDMYKDIKLRAKAKGEPAAEVIRDILQQGLNNKSDPKAASHGLAELASLGLTGGPRDLSANIDKYLYEDYDR